MIKYYTDKEIKGEFVLVIEGKSFEEIAKEEAAAWDSLTVIQHVDMYIEKGIEKKDAIKMVAKERNVPKREVYNEYTKS